MATAVRKLKLPKKRVLSRHEPPKSLSDRWKGGFSVREAQDVLEEVGLGPVPCPDTAPVMPPDIAVISSEELGTLHGLFVAFYEYLEEKVALLETDAAEKESYLEHVRAEVRLGKAGTVADKDAKTLNDPRVIEAEQDYLVAAGKARLLKARLRGYDKCAAALSREMSRRQGSSP